MSNAPASSPIVVFDHATPDPTATSIADLVTSDFWELYYRYPEIPEALCRKFATAISPQITCRVLHAEHRLGERIVMLLENVALRCGERKGDWIATRIPLSQMDIADHFGVTRQSVQREITSLKQANVLEKHEGVCRIAAGFLFPKTAEKIPFADELSGPDVRV